jgi:hypothetical protein
VPALRRAARIAQQQPPQPTPSEFRLPDLIRAARHGHSQFRNRDRFEDYLGWPHRKLLWLENNRIRPSREDLAQLVAALPLLRILLERVQPPERVVETAGRL